MRWIFLLCLLLPFLLTPSTARPENRPPRVVRVAAFNFYPAIFMDTDRVIKGFYVDALAEIGRRENIRFEYVYGSWNDGLERIRSGRVDLLTSVARTPERELFMDYGRTPLLTVWGELYVPLKSDMNGIRQLAGKRVAIMKGDLSGRNFRELVAKFRIPCTFVERSGFDDVFKAVASGDADAGVASSVFGAAKHAAYRLRTTGVVFNPFDIYFTVAQGENADLLALLDRHLSAWQSQQNSYYGRVRQQWTYGSIERERVPAWLVNLLWVLGGVSAVATIFVVLLRRQVNLATAAILEREATLRETGEMVTLLLNSTAEAIYGLDLEGNCTFCNTACVQMLGYSRPEDLLGRNMHDLIHHHHEDGTPFDRHECAIFKAFRQGEGTHSDDDVLWRADGTSFPVEYWSYPIRRGEEVLGAVVTFLDITARRLSEMALRDNENRYRTLVENAPVAVFVNREDRITMVNRACLELFGATHPNELLGTSIFKIFHPDYHDTIRQRVALLRGRGEALPPLEERVLRLDGTVVDVEVTAAPFLDRGVNAIHVVLRDITEAKRYERKLQDKNAELERFTYTVSHDLKSPLITIKSFAGSIRKDLAGNRLDRIDRDLARIEASADRMGDLLSDLLELSRIGRIIATPEEVDMERLVADVLAQLEGPLRERGVHVKIQPGLAPLVCDRQRIAEVLQNLVENAVKYMGDQPEPAIRIGMRREGEQNVYFVQDNGCGIDPRYHTTIFGLFNKLDASGDSTGIGLALAKRIVEVHGGRIWVESEGLGQGSTFCFTLDQTRDV